MGRQRQKRLMPFALSEEGWADALQLPARVVREAVKSGAVRAYVAPNCQGRIRILATDIVQWVQGYWQPADIRKQLKKVTKRSSPTSKPRVSIVAKSPSASLSYSGKHAATMAPRQ
jgi:hypothetical protein